LCLLLLCTVLYPSLPAPSCLHSPGSERLQHSAAARVAATVPSGMEQRRLEQFCLLQLDSALCSAPTRSLHSIYWRFIERKRSTAQPHCGDDPNRICAGCCSPYRLPCSARLHGPSTWLSHTRTAEPPTHHMLNRYATTGAFNHPRTKHTHPLDVT